MDTTTCPLCGGPNGCAIVQGQDHCWCFDAAIPAELLAEVPDESRGVRCVCQRCAAAARRSEPTDAR